MTKIISPSVYYLSKHLRTIQTNTQIQTLEMLVSLTFLVVFPCRAYILTTITSAIIHRLHLLMQATMDIPLELTNYVSVLFEVTLSIFTYCCTPHFAVVYSYLATLVDLLGISTYFAP